MAVDSIMGTMSGLLDKLKEAALKAGTEAQKDPRLMKAALNVKGAVDAFREGYRERTEPEKHKIICPHCEKELPPKANYCPHCGAQVD